MKANYKKNQFLGSISNVKTGTKNGVKLKA